MPLITHYIALLEWSGKQMSHFMGAPNHAQSCTILFGTKPKIIVMFSPGLKFALMPKKLKYWPKAVLFVPNWGPKSQQRMDFCHASRGHYMGQPFMNRQIGHQKFQCSFPVIISRVIVTVQSTIGNKPKLSPLFGMQYSEL